MLSRVVFPTEWTGSGKVSRKTSKEESSAPLFHRNFTIESVSREPWTGKTTTGALDMNFTHTVAGSDFMLSLSTACTSTRRSFGASEAILSVSPGRNVPERPSSAVHRKTTDSPSGSSGGSLAFHGSLAVSPAIARSVSFPRSDATLGGW